MMFKKFLMGALAALTLVGAAPAVASAAPVRECGGGGRNWSVIQNVTTRGLLCSDARRIARWYGHVEPGNYTRRMAPFWSCRVRQGSNYLMDVRCTHGSDVVRWQYSSGE